MSDANRLGRGLDSLLGSLQEQSVQHASGTVTMVPIEQLTPGPFQPRKSFDEESIKELAASIESHGIIQPIVARAVPQSGASAYHIITGERRWRAAQLAAKHEVPVLVRDIEDHDAMALALIENVQREDLNVVEIAELLYRLVSEFSMKHEHIARSVGLSRASVTNMLRLLSLDKAVLKLLRDGGIEAGHAKVLLALKNKDQVAAANIVVAKSMSVRATEQLVRNWNKKPQNSRRNQRDPDIASLERRLSDRLTAKVIINDRNGSGHIRINYQSLDELEGVLQRIG